MRQQRLSIFAGKRPMADQLALWARTAQPDSIVRASTVTTIALKVSKVTAWVYAYRRALEKAGAMMAAFAAKLNIVYLSIRGSLAIS
ncbi:MAG: hypothetical protein ACSHXK_17245 [Oceanococcus sp.]